MALRLEAARLVGIAAAIAIELKVGPATPDTHWKFFWRYGIQMAVQPFRAILANVLVLNGMRSLVFAKAALSHAVPLRLS